MFGLLAGSGGAILLNLFKGIFSFFEEKQNIKKEEIRNQHELNMLDRQGQIQANIATAKVQGDIYAADAASYSTEVEAREKTLQVAMKSDIWLVAFFNGMIRPLTTICYMITFFYLIWFCISFAAAKDLPPLQLVSLPIIASFLELNNMITSFWFINREFSKRWKK